MLAKDLVAARDERFKLVRAPEEAMRLGQALDVAIAKWSVWEGSTASPDGRSGEA